MTELSDSKKKHLQLKVRAKLEEKTLIARSAWTTLNGTTQGWKKRY
jgi:hypothetical protein